MRACPEPSAPDYYFPAGTFSEPASNWAKLFGSKQPAVSRKDSFERKWYANQFRALQLTSWSCGAFGQGYRFVWLRTFHHPISVSVVREEKGWVLYATELDGAGGYQPGSVLRTARIALDTEKVEHIRHQIEASQAWSLPTNESDAGNDGAQWIVELRDGHHYHAIDRWSPKIGSPVHALGATFLALTGWQLPERETY